MSAVVGLVVVACVGVSAAAQHPSSPDPRHLPLGDGRISTAPERGSVLACPGGPPGAPQGSQVDPPWIDFADRTYDLTAKAVVDGRVFRPGAEFTIRVDGDRRIVESSNLPRHPTGTFPVDPSDDAYAIDPNPNEIAPAAVRLALPAEPVPAARPSCIPLGAVGVLLSGVVLYGPLDEQQRDAVAHETQDNCAGHPQQQKVYHYHSLTPCLFDYNGVARRTADRGLVGYALDGFGIYGPTEGSRQVGSAELDECHGRVGLVEWQGRPRVMYHYVATLDFPYVVGCFRGTPVQVQGSPTAGRPAQSEHAHPGG